VTAALAVRADRSLLCEPFFSFVSVAIGQPVGVDVCVIR